MKQFFITYGDNGYEIAKAKICEEAKNTGEFDEIIAYGREDLSEELLNTDIIKIKRGGGLWSWKPDIILKTIDRCQDGDIIVYCDAGCTLYPAKEWGAYWKKLKNHDLIAQRIFMRTDFSTRKEILDYFKENGKGWPRCYQFQATIILRISDFTRNFIREWRDLLIAHPEFIKDVNKEELSFQHKSFIENRHDQAVYSALVYKYLSNSDVCSKIYAQWEHIENFDFFYKQAIRATRLRQGQDESLKHRYIDGFKRAVKDYVLKPFVYAPRQWWYFKQNKK